MKPGRRLASMTVAALLCIGAMAGCAVRQEPDLCRSYGEGEIHGTRLQEVMCTLRRAVYEDEHRSELERDDLRRRYALNLAETVATLTEELEDADAMMPGFRFAPDDAAVYAVYVRALKRGGENIRTIAQKYETEKLDPAVARMIRICNRCHARFGGPRL